jgi:acetolactate synthase-1/2/3 large subunit
MLSAADIIAQRLYRAGCRHAFGIPGGEVLALMDALERAGVAFHLTKHENPAGFMAEGTVHATGAPGVLLATVGPGLANGVNVVANAFQDRVPLIVLTGCVPAHERLTYTHQVFDHRALLAPITKATFEAPAGGVAAMIDKAVAIATQDQPGPVLIDVPFDLATADEPEPVQPDRVAPAPMAPAPGAALDAARAMFAAAERPLMVVGVDVLNQGCEEAVRAFAETFKVPTVTTYKAKGVVPEDWDIALGGAGLSPKADEHLIPLLRASDCIVLAGYDPIEMRTGWRDPWPADHPVIEFSAVPNTHYMHQARLSFVGHVGAGLAALAEGVSPKPLWPGETLAKVHNALKDAFIPDDAWGPAQAIAVTRRVMPADTVATADSGAHRILLSQMWTCTEPRQLLQSSALCTMGVALPLATGFAIAGPDVPVICFTGDAGLEMILGELATLRDSKKRVIVFTFVDASLALIEKKQRATGLQNLGVDFPATDFVAVAEAMGGAGRAVDTAADLEAALTEALDRDGFTLIACRIDRRAYDGTF